MKEIQPKSIIQRLIGKENQKPIALQKFWSEKKWKFDNIDDFFQTFTPAGMMKNQQKKKYNNGSKILVFTR